MTATKTFTGNYAGTCGRCGIKVRVAQAAAQPGFTIEGKKTWIACPSGCTRHNGGREVVHYFPAMAIYGTYNADKECNGKCMGATGPACDCKCGGENHGGRHA